ncbi:hypothetical protein ABH920_004102 [Catenulispora sp. EB89]
MRYPLFGKAHPPQWGLARPQPDLRQTSARTRTELSQSPTKADALRLTAYGLPPTADYFVFNAVSSSTKLVVPPFLSVSVPVNRTVTL